MKLSDFDYNLPSELIAQEPNNLRDHARLLVYSRENDQIEHHKFFNVIDYLKPGDILFVNNSKVFSARIKSLKETGGQVEIFLLKVIDKKKNTWQCLLGGRIKPGQELLISEDLKAKIIENNEGVWQISFNKNYQYIIENLDKIGQTPLPPYIKRDKKNKQDLIDYQTIYANDKKIGSAAAPTAGLHFTDKLLADIKSRGIKILEGTLHVGLGTFLPIKTENILEHTMHSEEIELSISVVNEIIKAKNNNQRIIAVGTTSARILESLARFLKKDKKTKKYLEYDTKESLTEKVKELSFSTDIFIYPGYNFEIINGLITNFHLPKSSLLLLVSALIGREKALEIYYEAISKKYKFFSYGDAMLII
ncbi:MAG TPA: tRNA preQ1(34) S-adenosylmethionine ribosyltransferase-isomerase QueA [bacterium]|nr:tRNA preQ1(34) S-adenosylmethionine ribosyltransferase-isomerase QueA [bacterium]